MKKSHKNAVMVVGAQDKAIEGEYLGKGGMVAGTVAISTFSGSLFAAIPAGVTTAIETAATDVATVGGSVILVIIGIKVWKWLRAAF